MKAQFTIRYIGVPRASLATERQMSELSRLPITRDRAAYYLTAARSRRRGNILRTFPHLYRVLDCGLVVEGGTQ